MSLSIFIDSGYLIVLIRKRDKFHPAVIPFSSEGMSKAFSLFKSRGDKTWGLVDCFSFVVMKENRIKQALTFDDHFRQAGFDTPLLG